MSLIEGNLQEFIKKEQKDYNSWKKEREIQAANDHKLAMLNAGGSKAKQFISSRQQSYTNKGGFVSSMR